MKSKSREDSLDLTISATFAASLMSETFFSMISYLPRGFSSRNSSAIGAAVAALRATK